MSVNVAERERALEVAIKTIIETILGDVRAVTHTTPSIEPEKPVIVQAPEPASDVGTGYDVAAIIERAINSGATIEMEYSDPNDADHLPDVYRIKPTEVGVKTIAGHAPFRVFRGMNMETQAVEWFSLHGVAWAHQV